MLNYKLTLIILINNVTLDFEHRHAHCKNILHRRLMSHQILRGTE